MQPLKRLIAGPALALAYLISMSPAAWAWGGRGHATICEVAPFLTQNPKLREFLTFRPQVMAHLCNVPDIYWKSLPPAAVPFGGESHWINPEVIGFTAKTMPLNFAELNAQFAGQKDKMDATRTIKNLAKDVGSLWWRADQLMNLAAQQKDVLKEAVPPKGREQEQDEKLPYNAGIYQWMVTVGVMGHFVGDASMPFHSTADHDGWFAGHGGIHFFYEDSVVGQFDGNLQNLVLQRARELSKKQKTLPFLKGTTLERMKALSVSATDDLKRALAGDPVLKKSSITEENGKKIKTPAERKSATVALAAYKNMIVDQMARSALLLAKMWDESYENIGSPDLSKYRSYRYPFTPDFISVDYAEAVELKKMADGTALDSTKK